MRINVKKLDARAVLPVFQHASDAGADLASVESVELLPGERKLVRTGIAIELPVGYAAFVHPRSGLAVKKGLSIVNSPGTIDAGYLGELMIPLINTDTTHAIQIAEGDRIAQLVVQKVEQIEYTEVADFYVTTDRSDQGFGSTGVSYDSNFANETTFSPVTDQTTNFHASPYATQAGYAVYGTSPAQFSPAAAPRNTAIAIFAGLRIKTLILSLAPVLFAFTANSNYSSKHILIGVLCALTAMFLQIFSNFANDYADIKTHPNIFARTRKLRLSETLTPNTLRTAALTFGFLAFVSGTLVIYITGHYSLLFIGLPAILAAWFYSVGKRAYGKFGLGDLAVFIFFGPIACSGTEFALTGYIGAYSLVLGIMQGFLACAVLMINNIRDINDDYAQGKLTFAGILGESAARKLLYAELAVPFAIITAFLYFTGSYFGTLPFFALPALIYACFMVKKSAFDVVYYKKAFNSALLFITSFAALTVAALVLM
jgi:1,4-dihydroxy-2-naphthoate octaprenyltransferase